MLTITKTDNEPRPFAPDVGGNLDLPPDERFVVWVKPLSGRQKMAIQSAAIARSRGDESAATAVLRGIVLKVVTKVENLTANDGARETPVENASQLWGAVEQGGAEWMSVIEKIIEFAEKGSGMDEETAGN